MPSSSQPSHWEFKSPLGKMRYGSISGQIDVGRPELGFHNLQWNESSVTGNILGATWFPADGDPAEAVAFVGDMAARVRESFVRGRDLVANYQPTSSWPFFSQVYWRIDPLDTPEDVLCSLLLMISLQTDLLDTHPQIDVRTQLTAEEVLFIPHGNLTEVVDLSSSSRPTVTVTRGEPGSLVFRIPGDRLSLVEMAHPSDFRQLDLACGTENYSSKWRLFAHFLEKGVIRRARMLSACVPRADDLALAAACFERFANSPLPLTA